MAERSARGTGDDPAWANTDLTGGVDSGTAHVYPGSLTHDSGPDETADLLNTESTEQLLHQPDPSMRPPRAAPSQAVDAGSVVDTMTDESGNFAATDAPGEDPGAARDPMAAGRSVPS